jgi:hypothetical protein
VSSSPRGLGTAAPHASCRADDRWAPRSAPQPVSLLEVEDLWCRYRGEHHTRELIESVRAVA